MKRPGILGNTEASTTRRPVVPCTFSVATPSVAGMVNLAGSRYSSSAAQLSKIYSDLGTSNLRDILSGTAGSFHCVMPYSKMGSDNGR